MAEERLGARWEALIGEVLTGVRAWRAAHPAATLAELEAAVDERLNRVRAQMRTEAALASRATEVAGAGPAARAACPECGHALVRRGAQTRRLTVPGAQGVERRRP